MQNQAARRGVAPNDRAFDDELDELARYVGQSERDGRGRMAATDLGLRGGQHEHDGDYARSPEPEAEPYDPRAYAPNPDEPYGYDADGAPLYDDGHAPQRSSNRGSLILVASVLAVALIGGAGAVGYRMLGYSGANGAPPLIRADAEPVKTVPENPGGAEVPHQNKAIYDRVDGAPQPKSQVVSRQEEPVELPAAPSTDSRGDGARVILPGGPASVEPTAPSTQGTEPRRVRTTVIRPDAPLAAAEPVIAPPPVSTANGDPIADIAARRGSEFDNGILADGAAPAPAQAPANVPVPRPRIGSGLPSAASLPGSAPGQTAAVRTPPAPPPAAAVPARPQAQPAPTPGPQAARPAPRPAPVEPQQQIAAAAPRPAAPAAPAPRAGAGGGFVVQVTSQRSEQDARAAYSNLQRRFPQVLGGYQATVQSATVGERGTYYRARVGPFGSSADASTVCNNLRAAGGDCVVARN